MGNDGFEDSGFDSLFDDVGFDSAGFGNDDGFDNSDGFDTSSGFDSFDSGDDGLEGSSGFSGADAQNNGGASISEDDLGNAFDNSLEDNQETPENGNEHGGLKKQAIIMVVVGVVALLLVIAIASAVGRHSSSNNAADSSNNSVNNNVVAQTPDNSANTRVDISDNNDYSNSNNTNNNSTNNNDASTSTDENSVKYVQDENQFNWVEITNNEDVQIEDNYSDMTFTVTGLKFYARSVDTNNNLVIKCVVSGSISGLSGTYTLDVPYNKGVRLVVGNSFTVHVQLGTYNGKTVVCDMKY